MIPGLERSTEEGIGYPLWYSWASLVAQVEKKPPAMRETWVRPLGWEDPLEKGKATHSSIQPGEFPGLWSMGLQRVRHLRHPKEKERVRGMSYSHSFSIFNIISHVSLTIPPLSREE